MLLLWVTCLRAAYRFKQPLFGSEQTHKGIIDTDGASLARGGKEYVQAIKEIGALKANSALGARSIEIEKDRISVENGQLD
jgi:hypothetical protein